METDPKCGIASTIHLGVAGDVTFAGGAEAFPVGRHIVEPLGSKLYEKPFEVHWANTTCVLLRADAVIECGLLDRALKFVCSDSDYSFTMRSRGWKVVVVPTSHIQHEFGRASAVTDPYLEEVKRRDFLTFISKWLISGNYKVLALEGTRLTLEMIQERIRELMPREELGG